ADGIDPARVDRRGPAPSSRARAPAAALAETPRQRAVRALSAAPGRSLLRSAARVLPGRRLLAARRAGSDAVAERGDVRGNGARRLACARLRGAIPLAGRRLPPAAGIEHDRLRLRAPGV